MAAGCRVNNEGHSPRRPISTRSFFFLNGVHFFCVCPRNKRRKCEKKMRSVDRCCPRGISVDIFSKNVISISFVRCKGAGPRGRGRGGGAKGGEGGALHWKKKNSPWPCLFVKSNHVGCRCAKFLPGLPSFTEFYRVLPSFTEFWRVHQ